jgi:hypothetical protein
MLIDGCKRCVCVRESFDVGFVEARLFWHSCIIFLLAGCLRDVPENRIGVGLRIFIDLSVRAHFDRTPIFFNLESKRASFGFQVYWHLEPCGVPLSRSFGTCPNSREFDDAQHHRAWAPNHSPLFPLINTLHDCQ